MIAVQFFNDPLLILDAPTITPDYAIGTRVRKYHQERVLTINGISPPNGNRPLYHFQECRGWYPEACLERVEE